MTTLTPAENRTTAQSLAHGTAGTALLLIERACNRDGSWDDVHAVISRICAGPVEAGPDTSLFYGAPAVAFVLHTTRADGRPRYQAAASTLGGHIHRIARQRLADAEARMRRGDAAVFAEYDLFRGLIGLGALLLRTAPDSDTVASILAYLIKLTRPQIIDGLEVPGWWAAHDPDPLLPTPGGHANFGMAHGAAGILAFLSLAALDGRTVDGQRTAISYLQAWFDQWQQESGEGPWWPQWLTRHHLRSGHPREPWPGRPSWCYGTAGIARALQLSALATSDRHRQQEAENTIAACLTTSQLDRVTSTGLCHGAAGLYQTASRAASNALSTAISHRLPALAVKLTGVSAQPSQPGFLTGDTGRQLALETTRHAAPPRSGWDACLLIT